jgi:hypothetical protein
MSQRHMAGLVPTVLEPNANVSFLRQGESAQGKLLAAWLGW